MKKHLIALIVLMLSFSLLFWVIADSGMKKTRRYLEETKILSVKEEADFTQITVAGQSIKLPEKIRSSISFTMSEGAGLYASLLPESVTVPVRRYCGIWEQLTEKMRALLKSEVSHNE